jgi:hypothetical protein
MFDNYIVRKGSTTYVPYEKVVTEKRAPTDESIKLLKEMEEKVLQKIVEAYHIESNIMNGVVFKTFKDPLNVKEQFIVVFNVNGKEHIIKKYVEEKELLRGGDAIMNIFADTIKDYLLGELLKEGKINHISI